MMTERGRRTSEKRHENDDPPDEDAQTPVNTDTTSKEDLPVVANPATSFQDAGEACIPDDQGRYGTSSGRNAQQIQYVYQLESKPNIPSQVFTYIIIPEIERRVSEIVVPVMFEEACGRSGTRRRRQLQQADGFTSFPPDTIISAQCQGSLTNSENICLVVQGNATVYSQNGIDEEMLKRARDFVAKGMNEGVFDKVHEGIVGVSYHGAEETSSSEKDVGVTQNTGGDDSRNSAIIWGPIVGVAVVGIVIAALSVRNSHKKKQQRQNTDPYPLGIRPNTPDDYKPRDFTVQTKSSWDVLAQNSPSNRKEELGISARELVHEQQEFGQSGRSSWDVLHQSSNIQGQPVLGISPTGIEDSRFVHTNRPTGEMWENEEYR